MTSDKTLPLSFSVTWSSKWWGSGWCSKIDSKILCDPLSSHICPLSFFHPHCSQFNIGTYHFVYWFFFFLVFSMTTPTAYGCSQTRGPVGAVAAGLCHRPTPQPLQLGIQALPATNTTVHGNAGSLTHWWRPGIEPKTSWFLVRFINHWATTGTPVYRFNITSKITEALRPHTDLWPPWWI